MGQFDWESRIRVGAQSGRAWHGRPGGFERLVPPWERVKVTSRTGGVEDGSRWVMSVGQGPFTLEWVAEMSGCTDLRFEDHQTKGPFARWRHQHDFEPDGANAFLMRDHIDYDLPLGALGRLFGSGHVRRNLERTFRWRHARVGHDLERHAAVDAPASRIVISGASGLIGRALTDFLTAGGHTVVRLVRRKPGPNEVHWDPDTGTIDAEGMEAADVVIHLAGAPVAAKRWTAARKRLILDSRTSGTALLARTLAGLRDKPAAFISCSAIGYYGHRGDDSVDEGSASGDGFLAEVCRAWEAAAEPARDAGIRVAIPRIGVVLSQKSGALAEMLTPYRLGVGAIPGDGKHWLSWVSLDDALGALHHAAFTPFVTGSFNVVSPNAVTHRTFAKTLGGVLKRPVFLRLPMPAVRLLFGELGQETLLQGARVLPTILKESGFQFSYPDLEAALRMELGTRS